MADYYEVSASNAFSHADVNVHNKGKNQKPSGCLGILILICFNWNKKFPLFSAWIGTVLE
jgi:hypothetical protein